MLKKNHKSISVASIDELTKETDYHNSSMEQKDMEMDMMQVLKMIDIKYREVTVYKYYLGLSDKEIAEMLHIPLGTVKSRLSRAKIKLKDIMGSDTESGVVL